MLILENWDTAWYNTARLHVEEHVGKANTGRGSIVSVFEHCIAVSYNITGQTEWLKTSLCNESWVCNVLLDSKSCINFVLMTVLSSVQLNSSTVKRSTLKEYRINTDHCFVAGVLFKGCKSNICEMSPTAEPFQTVWSQGRSCLYLSVPSLPHSFDFTFQPNCEYWARAECRAGCFLKRLHPS